ncbi:hypothetical protein JW756_01215 [Candidatus Woesearchaeota archaeon]|nr:hypothetical protein [Candidatus Woesearchaeota archaeon]
MATFLEIGLLEHFGVVFVILLVFLVIFGLMEYIKPFGDGKRGLHAIISLLIALLFLVSKIATNMVSFMVPWFMVVAIFIFFTLFLVRMFGAGEKEMLDLIKDPNVHPWVLIFVGLILAFGLANAFGQGLLEKGRNDMNSANYTAGGSVGSYQPTGISSTATPSFTTNLLNTLRHPKVMGMLFIFIMAAFALLFLTKTATKL